MATNGTMMHHARRYRDLIRAFNDDALYDQFVREHIAGDHLTQVDKKEKINESWSHRSIALRESITMTARLVINCHDLTTRSIRCRKHSRR